MTTRVSYNLKDALLIKETAFPSATGTFESEAFDLEDIGERGVRTDPFELLINVAEATAAQLPDGATNTFTLEYSDTPDFASSQIVHNTAWVQTGSAAGAEAVEYRFRPATDAPRYVRVQCVTGGSAAQIGKTFQFAIVT